MKHVFDLRRDARLGALRFFDEHSHRIDLVQLFLRRASARNDEVGETVLALPPKGYEGPLDLGMRRSQGQTSVSREIIALPEDECCKDLLATGC